MGLLLLVLHCLGPGLGPGLAPGLGDQSLSAAYEASELKDAGVETSRLKEVGFRALQLREAGFAADRLSSAGYDAAELTEAGYDAAALKTSFDARQLMAAGHAAERVVDAFLPHLAEKVGRSVDALRHATALDLSGKELDRADCKVLAALLRANPGLAELKCAAATAHRTPHPPPTRGTSAPAVWLTTRASSTTMRTGR